MNAREAAGDRTGGQASAGAENEQASWAAHVNYPVGNVTTQRKLTDELWSTVCLGWYAEAPHASLCSTNLPAETCSFTVCV